MHPPRRSPLLIPSTNDESTPVADPALDVCVPGAGGGGAGGTDHFEPGFLVFFF